MLISMVAAPIHISSNKVQEFSPHPGQDLFLVILIIAILISVRWF